MASRLIRLPRAMFDSDHYLAVNPDVAQAVQNGVFTDAYQHYLRYGCYEEHRGDRPLSMPVRSTELVKSSGNSDLRERIVDLEIEKAALLEVWTKTRKLLNDVTFEMLTDDVGDQEDIPALDREAVDESTLDENQRAWRRDGVVILPKLLPDDLIDRYCLLREKVPDPNGWACATPYMYFPELRNICLYEPLVRIVTSLVGEEVALSLNQTHWVSTERTWHQDDLCNQPYVNAFYAAVWMALDRIHPESGPFEYVPGSHRWRLLRSHKIRMFLEASERDRPEWPNIAERFVTQAVEREIARVGTPIRSFLGERGDVLIWHGRLVHRGSPPLVRGMQRKALIAHYTGIPHREGIWRIKRHTNGCAYFDLPTPLDFDPRT